MSKTGTFLSVASSQQGATPRIVTETEGLPVVILNLAGENVAEQYSESLRVISSGHAWIHKGKAFIAGNLFSGIANGSSVELLIEPTAVIHAIFPISCTGDAIVYFFEDTTKTTGTALTSFNKNRNSAITSGATISHTPAGIGDGIMFPPGFIAGGSGGNAAGGSGMGYASEFVLYPGKKYLLRITNQSGSNAYISANVEYYEPSAT